MTDLNSNTSWSPMALDDLDNAVKLGKSAEEVAEFLCRDVEEVRAKIAERAA